MKVIVNTPLAGDKVAALLDGHVAEGVTYRFVSKNGMRLEFEVDGAAGQDAVDLTKKLIRSTDFGNALFFQVTTA